MITVGVELGGGCVDLCEKFPLEGRERQAHPDAFKYRLVHEKERVPLSRSVIYANGFPRPAGTEICASWVRQKALKLYRLGSPRWFSKSFMVVRVVHSLKSSSGVHE